MRRVAGKTKTAKQQEVNRWFARRRDYFFTKMLKCFYQTTASYNKIYLHYLAKGYISYDEIDHLVGSEKSKGRLWLLKDDCHQIWRDADPSIEVKGCLLDWVIGSLFHEAMKLKENIYLFQFYGPMAQDMTPQWHAEIQSMCGIECHRFMGRISREISRQVENLVFLFGRANYLLRTLLDSQSTNALLLRYLVEHEEVVLDLWFESLDEIFTDVFSGRPERGYCIAARSYLDGNWNEKALQAYSRALHLNSECAEARQGVMQINS